MKMSLLLLTCLLALAPETRASTGVKAGGGEMQAVNVSWAEVTMAGKRAIRVTKDPKVERVDEPTFVRLAEQDFRDGLITVQVLSRLLPNAPEHARGFIGVAFRIDPSNSRFEAIYIRPTNGRADDQVRRNRSTQYFSYPDFKFDRLRTESPGRYESYADMGLDEWITLRIEVSGTKARLFVNGAPQPALRVNDLKHGPDAEGGIGLWVDVGTEGYFADFSVEKSAPGGLAP